MENPSQDAWTPGQDVEPGYGPTVLTSQPRNSARIGRHFFLQIPNSLYSILACFTRPVTEAHYTLSNTHIKTDIHN
jgi:hypothetical protein